MQFFLHLLYAGTLTILSYLSTKLTRSTWLSMIIMMGLLWLPKIIVAQTFGWNAGFINYVFALVFPLWLLTLADTEIIDKNPINILFPF